LGDRDGARGSGPPPAEVAWPLQAVAEEGVYAHGKVTVALLPEEVYGSAGEATVALRRLEDVLSEEELQALIAQQLLKARPGPRAAALRARRRRFRSV
jgi:type II secretory pathway predicted ATPase ExeA